MKIPPGGGIFICNREKIFQGEKVISRIERAYSVCIRMTRKLFGGGILTLFIPRSLRRGAAGYFSGGERGIFPEYSAAEWKFPFFQNGPLSADASKPPPASSVRCFASSLTLLCPEAEWKFPFSKTGPFPLTRANHRRLRRFGASLHR